MSNVVPHLERGVLIGVGAAFDFHAGTVVRSPGVNAQHRVGVVTPAFKRAPPVMEKISLVGAKISNMRHG